MAVLLDITKQHQPCINSPAVTAVPYTFACWFNSTDQDWTGLVWVGDKDRGTRYSALGIYGTLYDKTVFVQSRNGGLGQAVTSTQWSDNTWHHACGVFLNNTSRDVYLDGAGKGSNATATSVSTYDRTALGWFADSTPGGWMDGMLAEAAIWNTNLTEAEIAVLAKGYSPLFVRPQNLVAYWPIVRPYKVDTHNVKLNDIVGSWTVYTWEGIEADLPVAAAHCRIIHPAPVHTLPAAAQLGITPLLLRAIEKY